MEEALAKAFGTFTERARHEVPDLRDAIADTNPDALLIDITTVGAAALADAAGLPWAQSIPLFQSFTPGPGAATGLRSRAVLPRPRARPRGAQRPETSARAGAADEPGRGLARPVVPVLHRAAARACRPRVPAVVPLRRPGPLGAAGARPVLARRAPGAARHRERSSEFQNDHALIETALLALSDEPVGVAVSTAAHDPEAFAAPANARLERWLPHGALLAPRGMRRLPRRHGHHAEDARRRRAALHRPVRARPVRSRRTRRGPRRRHVPAARRAQPQTRCEPPCGMRSRCVTAQRRSPARSLVPEAPQQPRRHSRPSSRP